MSTAHIEAEKNEISKLVLMPGDPLRAKYIADNFLEDVKLVNKVRNMYFYTGLYKGIRVTIAASGMGIPSMGIYAYELIKFYDVKKIIRIGTCGSFNENIKLEDLILSSEAFSYTYFNKLLSNEEEKTESASLELNKIIIKKSQELNLKIKYGKTITSDVFDLYCDDEQKFRENFENDYIGVEMEAFALFHLAKKFKIDASTLLTVVDSLYDKRSLTAQERQTGLNNMITLALDSIIEGEI